MKKFLFVVVSLFLSLTFANANDLLFKASNGALNQNSLGVKKLTDEEMTQVRGGWFSFQRAPGLDFYNSVRDKSGFLRIYRSYAYIVVDNQASYNERYSSAAKRLGFDPKYYGSGVMVVGKIRWINGKKQHFMQAGTNKNNLGNVWNYGVMAPVYREFQRY